MKPKIATLPELHQPYQARDESSSNGSREKIFRETIRHHIVAGRVGVNIILLMLEFNSFSSSNFLSS